MDCVRLGRCRSKTTVHADEREEEWAELNKTSTYTEKHHLEYRHVSDHEWAGDPGTGGRDRGPE